MEVLRNKENELRTLFDTSVKMPPQRREQIQQEAEQTFPRNDLMELRLSYEKMMPTAEYIRQVRDELAAIGAAMPSTEYFRHMPTKFELNGLPQARMDAILQEGERFARQSEALLKRAEEPLRYRVRLLEEQKFIRREMEMLRNLKLRGL